MILAFFLFLGCGFRSHRTHVIVLTLCGFIVLSMFGELVATLVIDTRFNSIMTGQDVSLGNRFLELRDVIEQIYKGNTFTWLFGEGFGATYEVNYSKSERNFDELGNVHNIHISPINIFFRYGLLGVFLMLSSFTLYILKYISSNTQYERALLCIVISYFIEASVRNAFLDPFFILTLVIYNKRFSKYA